MAHSHPEVPRFSKYQHHHWGSQNATKPICLSHTVPQTRSFLDLLHQGSRTGRVSGGAAETLLGAAREGKEGQQACHLWLHKGKWKEGRTPLCGTSSCGEAGPLGIPVPGQCQHPCWDSRHVSQEWSVGGVALHVRSFTCWSFPSVDIAYRSSVWLRVFPEAVCLASSSEACCVRYGQSYVHSSLTISS